MYLPKRQTQDDFDNATSRVALIWGLSVGITLLISLIVGIWACYRWRRNRRWQRQYVANAQAQAAQGGFQPSYAAPNANNTAYNMTAMNPTYSAPAYTESTPAHHHHGGGGHHHGGYDGGGHGYGGYDGSGGFGGGHHGGGGTADGGGGGGGGF